MIRRPPRSTQWSSSAASDVYKRQINCWMEAKIAEKLIDNAGEYNGFLKIEPQARILSNPLKFKDGFLIISENWDLEIDRDKLEKYSTRKETIYN